MSNSFEGKKVFVTGAAGSIGSHLTERLIAQGANVYGLTRSQKSAAELSSKGIAPVIGDLDNYSSLLEGMHGTSIVYHLAAWMGIANISPEAHAINVEGTRAVVNIAEKTGVDSLVNLSTTAVYGRTNEPVIGERSPLKAKEPYGGTKVVAEEIVRSSKLHTVSLRPGPLYGPRIEVWSKKTFEKVRDRKQVGFDDGKGRFNGCYIDDLVDSMIAAADPQRRSGESYNIVSSGDATWKDFISYFEEATGNTAVFVPGFVAVAGMKIVDLATLAGIKIPASAEGIAILRSSSKISNAKVKLDLGVTFTPFEKGMNETMKWVKKTLLT